MKAIAIIFLVGLLSGCALTKAPVVEPNPCAKVTVIIEGVPGGVSGVTVEKVEKKD
ncbi:hypothetical protein LCGC14_2159270 [marine sediment metagenome]|uniref:Uncharacterized protein n=1 Tax=marine sediment metagenome TaxID=412755 RepID=A0A0F9G652_9ZZZZ